VITEVNNEEEKPEETAEEQLSKFNLACHSWAIDLIMP
jgi:hypothetical protein